jgi:hypothetical protein
MFDKHQCCLSAVIDGFKAAGIVAKEGTIGDKMVE